MRNQFTLGIDEAGRGPVLGPMVMSCVCLDAQSARYLTKCGVRDSKLYGAAGKAKQQRAHFAALIYKVAIHVGTYIVDVAEIDNRVRKGELNLLEREVAEALIAEAPSVKRMIADGARLFKPLQASYPNLVALDNAESKHCAVAAASIVAKHRRDEIFDRIQCRYRSVFGELRGGGYVNAPTREFLRNYARRFNQLPPEARKSWPHEYLTECLREDSGSFK